MEVAREKYRSAKRKNNLGGRRLNLSWPIGRGSKSLKPRNPASIPRSQSIPGPTIFCTDQSYGLQLLTSLGQKEAYRSGKWMLKQKDTISYHSFPSTSTVDDSKTCRTWGEFRLMSSSKLHDHLFNNLCLEQRVGLPTTEWPTLRRTEKEVVAATVTRQ